MEDCIFTPDDVGCLFSWNQLNTIHKTRNGIYQRGGRLVSLLTDFGLINPCYPDTSGNAGTTIEYTGCGRRGDQTLDTRNRALLDAVESRLSVPLFNKLAPGRWKFLGFWIVVAGRYVFDEKQDRMLWKFTLERER